MSRREGAEEPLEALGGRTTAGDQAWGDGFWLFKDPSCHFREPSLPFHHHLWLINEQLTTKG